MEKMENLPSNQNITYSFISAVREGNLEEARELIHSFGPFYSKGYFLLRHALRNKHAAVAKLLLTNGAEVNGETSKPLDTPLHLAVMNGDIEIVNMILEKGANIEARNESGQTPFHVAIKRGRLQIAEDLLKYGADINCRCIIWKKNYTPLHLAVEKGDTYADVVMWLLYTGANVDVKGEDSMTPLHIAAKNGYIRIAEYLLSYGACIHSSTLQEGYTPLHFSSELNNEKAVELFLGRGADIDARTKDDSMPLHIATEKGRETVVKILLQHGAKVDNQDKNDKTTLQLAVEGGNSKIVEEILKYCPDINDRSNRSSLKIAVHGYGEEYSKIVEALLEYGFIVDSENANDPEFLYAALQNGHLKIVQDLLKYGVAINASDKYGRTALHLTAGGVAGIDSKGEIARLLLSKGAHIDAQTEKGVTALYTAIVTGNVKVVEALLEYDANINCESRSDSTALHVSAREGNKDISIMLLDKGANVNAKEKYGMTPLHIAAQEGHGKVVKVLLECGARVDSKDKSGTTPLHQAAGMDHREIIETLLEYGANINSRDKWGRTALHIASHKGYDKVVAALLEHGSDINITNRRYATALDVAKAKMIRLPRPCYSSSPHEAVVKTLKRHIVKMRTANLYVSEKNLQSISKFDKMIKFQDECEEEIARMKCEEINNTNFSFYDILVKDTSSLARYMRNENIVQVLKLDTYKTKFPIYARMIENNFRKGMERRELLERGNESLHVLFNNLPKLSLECIEKIIDYFSDEDLRNLIDACKPCWHQ